MAKKRNSRSLVDLMSNPTTPTDKIEEVVDEAVNRIHKSESSQTILSSRKDKPKTKTIRVSVDTPQDMHKQLKKIAVDFDMDLKTFFLTAVKEKCARAGYTLPEGET